MMLAFFLLSLATLAGTWTLSRKRIAHDDPATEVWGLSWLEGMTRFLLLWIGGAWALAGLHWLRPAGFMGLAIIMAALALWLFRRNPETQMTALAQSWTTLRSLRREWLFMGLLGLLLAFNLIKGWVLPCANSDALAWSLPIAIRYHLGSGLDWAMPPQTEWLPHLSDPHNYELLIASILSLTGTDRITEWVSTLAAGGVLSVVGIQFRRWSGPGLHVWTTLLLFAAAPVFLLHLAADKGDLLTILLVLLGIFWTVRACLEASPRSGILAIWVLFALFNMKRSGWMLAPPLVLVIYLRWTLLAWQGKARWVPTLLRIAGHGLGAALGMGGIKALWLWHHTKSLSQGVTAVATQLSPSAHAFSWADPLRFLWTVSLAPFRSSDYTVRLLSGVEWYWPEYNLIYSHFGWLFGPALLAALGLLAAALFRRGPARAFSREQWLCLDVSIVLAFFLLARNYAFDGGFNTFPRFVLFLLPPLLAAGFLPLLARVPRPWIFAALAAIGLVGAASQAYVHDMVAPYVYLEDLWQHPEKRRWVLVGPNRVPCVLDRLAGPKAVVVADCTYLTWLAPLWGEGLTRDVRLLEWKEGRPQVPPEAEWLVIDNVSGLTWGNGHVVRNAGDFAKAFQHGTPTERDTRLFPILKSDPTWELVTASPMGEQAIFRRKPAK